MTGRPGDAVHVAHPLLKPGAVEFRGYQANLARIAGQKDTLVVLPTGMGKTVVAVLTLADALRDGAQRILLLAPTKPLADQHGKSFRSLLGPPWDDRVTVQTGETAPGKRKAAREGPGLLIATPQVVHNDVLAGHLDLSAFDWVVFDEAHRAVGDYPYAFLGRELQKRHPKGRRLGLTASPGHDVRKIEEVRQNLGLAHVEIRTPADPDVAPFVQEVGMEWETLPLPPTMARVSAKLTEALADRVRQLKGLGKLKSAGSRPSRRDLLETTSMLQQAVQREASPDPALFSGLSIAAQAMKLQHAIEQVETQGAAAFVEYLEGIRAEASGPKPTKASKAILEDPRVNEAYHVARFDTAETPKLGRVGVLAQEALEGDPESRVIVFTHYRSTCEQVVERLSKLPGVRPVLFVGQSKKGDQAGLTQKQQADIVARFRKGDFNVLVATSVAEEGLDIPETDLVVFYEPIPSEIRSIQRRGRTGRKRAGRVVVLMTKGTQDEAAHWVSRRKEQAMVKELHHLRSTLTGKSAPLLPPPPTLPKGQSTLSGPAPGQPRPATAAPTTPTAGAEPQQTLGKGPRILVDHRETAGGVARHLHELGAQVEPRQLEVGDFVLSDRVAVERKTTADFVDSLVDGRLFDQLRELKAYPRPFLVLEGESLYGHRNVTWEAILGAVAAVTVDHGIPLLQTKDAQDTARFLVAVAKREQQRENRKLAVRHGRPLGDEERQLFLLCGLPGVSDVLAKRLLDRFGTVAAVFAAPVRELAEVEGLGPSKASEIRRVLDLPTRRREAGLAPRSPS
jgi:ERCC4-related helicase/ERCC4-type nuclease